MRKRVERRQRRRAAVIVEFLIAFPILLIASLAVIQFALIGLVEHFVNAAAVAGAREAAKVHSTVEDAVVVVEDHLEILPIIFDSTGFGPGQGDTHVIVNMDGADSSFGNSSIVCPPASGFDTDRYVAVTICVELGSDGRIAPGGKKTVIPDLLSTVGFTVKDRTITARSLALIE